MYRDSEYNCTLLILALELHFGKKWPPRGHFLWYNMLMNKLSYDGPIVLAILDGVGLAPDGPGNAVSKARTSFLGRAAREYPHIALDASGEAVGLVAGQMGNSEVGHNTMGAGRAIKQGIARIEEAFATGEAVGAA